MDAMGPSPLSFIEGRSNMGQPPKSKIAELKRKKKEAKAAKKRKENNRTKIVRFLIVCEGKCTEPNYFNALVQNHYSQVREAQIEGKGKSTCSLVKQAIQMRLELEETNQLPYDRVWVVFDKDDFQDFNKAIALAKKHSLHVAWTNEAFELWYILHFQYLQAGVSRHQYIDILEKQIQKHPGYKDYVYKKNDPNIYRILSELGDEEAAKRLAKKLRNSYSGKNYSTFNPCTTVYQLVEELEYPEKLLK